MKKAQGMVEFIIILSAVLFFAVIFLGIIQANIREKNLEKEQIIARDLALAVQDEVSLAQKSSDGYYREFELPQTILGKEYEITIVDGTADGRVYVSAYKIGISYQVTDVTGNVQKGTNIIQKQNGIVLLNQ